MNLHPTPQADWEKTTCPICNREYQFQGAIYKPTTCGDFDCLQEARKRGLLPKKGLPVK